VHAIIRDGVMRPGRPRRQFSCRGTLSRQVRSAHCSALCPRVDAVVLKRFAVHFLFVFFFAAAAPPTLPAGIVRRALAAGRRAAGCKSALHLILSPKRNVTQLLSRGPEWRRTMTYDDHQNVFTGRPGDGGSSTASYARKTRSFCQPLTRRFPGWPAAALTLLKSGQIRQKAAGPGRGISPILSVRTGGPPLGSTVLSGADKNSHACFRARGPWRSFRIKTRQSRIGDGEAI